MPKYDVGELITELNDAVNKLNNLRTKHDDLEKENARLRAALRDLLTPQTPASFAGAMIRARAALGEKE
jgi:hypothetical protein